MSTVPPLEMGAVVPAVSSIPHMVQPLEKVPREPCVLLEPGDELLSWFYTAASLPDVILNSPTWTTQGQAPNMCITESLFRNIASDMDKWELIILVQCPSACPGVPVQLYPIGYCMVGPDGRMEFTAVQMSLLFALPLAGNPRAVVTQLKNEPSIQGQERNPVSPDVTIQMGDSMIDDLTSPLTVTFQDVPFQSDIIPCSAWDSGGNGPFNQNGCNPPIKGTGNRVDTITCRCDRLGFFFVLTLESKDIFAFFPSGDPFKITTQSNLSNHVSVTTPVTGRAYETPLESSISTSSSAGPTETCEHLWHQLNEREQCTAAVGIVNKLIQRCTNHTPHIPSIISGLENKLLIGDCETDRRVIETENVIFFIQDTEAENFPGLQFPNADTENISAFHPAIRISLSPTLLDNINITTKMIRSKVILFRDARLFQVKNQTVLNHVVGIEVGSRALDNLTDPVIIVFYKPSPVKAIPKCVFWELQQNGNTAEGHWNDSGCTTQNTVNEVICRCNHLTFFAVLLQIDGNQHLDEKTLRSLTYITQIGCGVSGIFTAITLIIHFILRKRQKEASIQIHVNLSVALFLLNVSFLTSTVFSSESTDDLCKAIAVLLHYSLLCSFTWMGIEAFHLYLMLIKVFNIYIRFYMLKLCLLGWGLPAGVLLIIIGVHTDNYGQYSILVNGNYAHSSMCWIKNKTVHYVTNIAYFALVFLSNSIVLLIVGVKMFRLKGRDRKSVITVLGLTCLLGITYGIAFFSYGPQSVTAMYLFCILNPLQGFFIFLWYCMLIRSPSSTVSETSKSTTT
ncbi:adhesion G-protein coupled receptor G5-like [Chiloscyllium punctatum]